MTSTIEPTSQIAAGGNKLRGRVAFVTGGTRGIGAAISRSLASQGATVAAGYGRNTAQADQFLADLNEKGRKDVRYSVHRGDVANADDCRRTIDEVIETHGRLDILVNNAGIFLDDTSLAPSAQPLPAWRETFDTNLFGVIATTQALLPLLRRSPAGRIVNLSSSLASLALHNDPNSQIYDLKVPAYDASKTALNAWTVHLAHELRDTPIKVNAVDPGSVKTDMNAHGELDIATGASGSVAMALVGADGPNGSYTHLGHALPW